MLKSPVTLETSLIIQAVIEGLTPQQILTRDLLVAKGLLSNEEATDLISKAGPVLAAEIKAALSKPAISYDEIIQNLLLFSIGANH
jgi:hypothetical protein